MTPAIPFSSTAVTIMLLLSHCLLVCGFAPSLPTRSARQGLLVSKSHSHSHLISELSTHAHATRIALFSSTSTSSCTTGDSDNSTTTPTTQTTRQHQPLDRIIRLRGKVATGYGRGGKKLGFPTANLPSSFFQNALQHVPTGVYFGWAWIERDHGTNSRTTPDGRGVAHKAAVNVGYSPTFEGKENAEKIVEAHLILNNSNNDDDGEGDPTTTTMTDFYGEFMRLLLVGYLRPECKFDSFPALMQAITSDVETAKMSLDEEPYSLFRSDAPFLRPPYGKTTGSFPPSGAAVWIGVDGGNVEASWEFQDWNEAQAKLSS